MADGRLLICAALLVLVAGLESPAGAHAEQVGSRDTVVGNSDRSRIVADYNDVLLPTLSVPIGWNGSVSGCVAGRPSAAAQTATADALTYLRGLDGLDPVTLDPGMSADAQQSALMMDAQNDLSHAPPPSWACYSQTGADTAGESNLYLGETGAQAMVGYTEDPGSNNTVAGHRRWILNPSTRMFGSGLTSGANALQVFGGPADSHSSSASAPAWIPWPAAGYFPSPLEPDGRWSLSASADDISFDDASVTMQGPAGMVTTHVEPVADGYGPNTLVWEASHLAVPTPEHDVAYTVTVSDVRDGGTELAPVTYTVTLVDPAQLSSPPGHVRAQAADRSARVSWTAAPGDGDPPVTAYRVSAHPGNRHIDVGGDLTSATVTGLANGTAYTFTVAAIDASGTSADSVASNAVTPAGAPSAVRRPGATVRHASVTISWVAPDEQGSPITSYTVTGSHGLHTTVNGTTRRVVFRHLTTGRYTFRVTATNAVGSSPPSAAVSVSISA